MPIVPFSFYEAEIVFLFKKKRNRVRRVVMTLFYGFYEGGIGLKEKLRVVLLVGEK